MQVVACYREVESLSEAVAALHSRVRWVRWRLNSCKLMLVKACPSRVWPIRLNVVVCSLVSLVAVADREVAEVEVEVDLVGVVEVLEVR